MALGPQLSAPSSLHTVGMFALFHTLLMFSVGGYFGIKSGLLAVNGATAEGTVVEMTRGSKGAATPTVEFSTPTGQRIRFKGDVASSPPAFHEGEKVTVLYSPSEPSIHAIQSFTEMWLLPSILLPLGGTGGIFATVLIVVGTRRKRARERVMATGLHAPATVVGSKSVQLKKSMRYEPEVELRDPRTGEIVRCMGDRQPGMPVIGGAAMVHVDASPPHGYFVEMR